MNKRKTFKTDLICPQCYNRTFIRRIIGRERPFAHKKKLYCIKCKEEVDHIEVRDIDLLEKDLEFLTKRTEKEEEMLTLVKKVKRSNISDHR